MRKSTTPTPNYPSGFSRGQEALATFRDQMADYARAEHLRDLRAQIHESQENVAHKVGVSVKTLRTWEAGGKIRWENAKRLAAFYGVDPELLVSRDQDDTPGAVPDVGSSQLDRLEKKVDELLSLVRGALEIRAPELLQQLADAELAAATAPAQGSPTGRPKRTRRAS